MTKYKIEIYDETNDEEPVRTEVIDAENESEAAEKLVERMRSGEKRGDATPQDEESFTLDRDKLSGGGKLG